MMPDMKQYLAGRTLILVSNREPYEHTAAPDGEQGTAGESSVQVRRPPGGLVSALDPTMRCTHGTWVAWGSGSADRETADAEGRLAVPPENPAYTLRRVWLDDADVDGYYLGFANSALWPLCHMLLQHYDMRAEYWERYKAVNERFAAAAADEARRAPNAPVVWVQDYHFALVSAMVRERLAGERRPAFLHQFWHIPFPPPDILRLLPTAAYSGVMRGLLGNDLVEFHTDRYALNFLDCVDEFVPESRVDRDRRRVVLGDREIHAGVFPISIDAEQYESLARAPEAAERARELRHRHVPPGGCLGVSVDRVDYTKGIPERLRALDQLWTDAPELRRKLTFIVVATPSRSELRSYKTLEEEVVASVAAINAKFGDAEWTPIVLLKENVSADGLAAIYRAGDVCLVSSLQDGMNLVAKEFIACNVDGNGVLVLSRFTGAAAEIDDAILINPFHVDGVVEGLRHAVTMPVEERRARMQRMQSQLHRSTIFDWLEAILARVNELASGPAELRPPTDRPVGSDRAMRVGAADASAA